MVTAISGARATVVDEAKPVLSPMDRQLKRRWPGTRGLLILLALAAAVAAASLAYVVFGLGRTLTVSHERVVISTVHSGTFREEIPLTATIVPRDTTYLDVVEGGQVAEVLVEEGALVRAGQPLLRLKNANLDLEVIGRETQLTDQLKQLASTRLSFEQARIAHERELIDIRFQIEQLSQRQERRKALFPFGVVSQAEISDGEAEIMRYRQLKDTVAEAQTANATFQRTQLDQLEALIDGLKKNLLIARENVQRLIMKAPIAGQLTSLEAHVGESKAPGQRMGQIDRVDSYKATTLVDEFYLARVAAGQKATAEIDGKQQGLDVAKVYPQVKDRQFKVDLLFTGAALESLRRGQTLELRLEIGAARKSLLVANGPFYEDTGGRWAFVLSSSGNQADRRVVRLGRRNPDTVEVVDGLSDGERVITSGYETFKAFDRIQLRGGGTQ